MVYYRSPYNIGAVLRLISLFHEFFCRLRINCKGVFRHVSHYQHTLFNGLKVDQGRFLDSLRKICPNGAPTYSPGLPRFGGYPGNERRLIPQPQRGCVTASTEMSKAGATALRLRMQSFVLPRVAVKARQPWAVRRSPVGHNQRDQPY
jgi:hypothetical protein